MIYNIILDSLCTILFFSFGRPTLPSVCLVSFDFLFFLCFGFYQISLSAPSIQLTETETCAIEMDIIIIIIIIIIIVVVVVVSIIIIIIITYQRPSVKQMY